MTAPSLPSPRQALAAFAVVSLLAGCKKTATEAVTAAALTVVQGNNQSIQAGKELPTPIVLRVTSSTGSAMANVPVTMTVSAGGGTITPASGVSDAKGEYTAKWTLGPTFQENEVRASVPGLDPVKITANGIVPTDIVIAQGNAQTAKVGAALTTSIVIRVVGSGNTPMSGVTVLLQVVTGGGSISPQSAVTSSLGEVTVKWTLGTLIGTQAATVSALALSPVTIFATATP